MELSGDPVDYLDSDPPGIRRTRGNAFLVTRMNSVSLSQRAADYVTGWVFVSFHREYRLWVLVAVGRSAAHRHRCRANLCSCNSLLGQAWETFGTPGAAWMHSDASGLKAGSALFQGCVLPGCGILLAWDFTGPTFWSGKARRCARALPSAERRYNRCWPDCWWIWQSLFSARLIPL